MVKNSKSIMSPMKKIIQRQDEPQRPPTLGEPSQSTNWLDHIEKEHKLLSFAKIQTERDGKKQAYVNTPTAGQYFIARREDFCGFYYVWILCIQEATNRILFRVNSGDVDFVNWIDPNAVKGEKNDTVTT